MNLQFYLEKLETSGEFKKFQKDNPDAFLGSAFFVIDFEGKDEKQHLDFFDANKKEMWSFQMEESMKKVPIEVLEGFENMAKLNAESVLDFNEIEKMILFEMKKKEIKSKLQKIIMVLQNINKKDIWVCTCFVSGLGMLKINIDDADKKILSFEKKSFFQLLRKG